MLIPNSRLPFLDASGAVFRRAVVREIARQARREIERCVRRRDHGSAVLAPDPDFRVPSFREAYRRLRQDAWMHARAQAECEAMRRDSARQPIREQLARSCELEAELARRAFPPDEAKASHFDTLAAQARSLRAAA